MAIGSKSARVRSYYKDVPSDCTVVGILGRIVARRQNKSNVNPAALPDMGAEVIKILFDRIRCLEQEIASLQQRTGLCTPNAIPQSGRYAIEANIQPLASDSYAFITDRDRAIEDFLDGAGI